MDCVLCPEAIRLPNRLLHFGIVCLRTCSRQRSPCHEPHDQHRWQNKDECHRCSSVNRSQRLNHDLFTANRCEFFSNGGSVQCRIHLERNNGQRAATPGAIRSLKPMPLPCASESSLCTPKTNTAANRSPAAE